MSQQTSEDNIRSDETAAADLSYRRDRVGIPRWVVYFQAALLGIVATTFFIFGIMVGSLGSGSNRDSVSPRETRITGLVAFKNRDGQFPDAGAVIFLLPDRPVEILRQSPNNVRPHNFEPLENEAIEWIQKVGGSVVRANRDGRFELFALPGKYNLLVISKAVGGVPSELSKQQSASISQYFLPVEQLIQKQHFLWQPLQVEGELLQLGQLIFE